MQSSYSIPALLQHNISTSVS